MRDALRELPDNLRNVLRVARLRPFDTSTAEGRSLERYRRIVLGTAASLIGRVVTTAAGFVVVPIALSSLGRDGYGLWVAASALGAWIGLLDPGLSAGLLNGVAESEGRDDHQRARVLFSTAFFTLALVSFLALFIGALLLPLLSWETIISIPRSIGRTEVAWTVAAILGLTAAALPFGTVAQVYAGTQRAYVATVFSTLGSVFSLGALLIAVALLGSLPAISAALASGALVAGVASLAFLVWRVMPGMRPRLSDVSRSGYRRLLASAAPLYLFQIGSLLVNQSQALVLARRAGLGTVTSYDIVWRFVVLGVGLVTLSTSSAFPTSRMARAHPRTGQSTLMSASLPRRLAARFRRWFLGEKLWQQSRPGFDLTDPLRLNLKAFGYQLARELGPGLARVDSSDEPRDHGLGCKATIQADLESGWFAHWCRELHLAPIYHRKLWEYAYVLQVLHEKGQLRPGASGLGFGCGEEPIPSYLASRGVAVTVTDLDPEQSEGRGWVETGQHATSVEKAWKPELVDRSRFDALVRLAFVDMNRIPAELESRHDFCWSICAMEHLGSIELGLRFVEESLRTVRPGGIAIHTTEFNFLSESETVTGGPTVLFLQRHFEELAHRLEGSGHRVGRLDFDVGDGPVDRYVDLPPFTWDAYPRAAFTTGQVHLKLALDGYPSTCFGIWVEKVQAR